MDYSVLDDMQLAGLLRKGHEKAYAEIYHRYWKLLYNTAYHIIRSKEVAQDGVQEVFIALWQRRTDANIQHLKAYLLQAVRFQVLKAIRAQKTDDQFCARLAAVTSDMVYEHPLLFKEQEALLNEILGQLPEDCLTVFKMSREAQLTYKQIAQQLAISEKTVEKRMALCLKQIRQALERNLQLCIALWIVLKGGQ